MPVSQTAEYALRAVICLARHTDAQTTQHLADCTKVPQSYLPKVLQPLTKAKIVSAQRGVRGGYQLQRRPEDLTVLEVVNCVDRVRRLPACPGHQEEPEAALCPLHKMLDKVLAVTEKYFAETTIRELAYLQDGTPATCGHLDTPQQEGLEHAATEGSKC